jgi:glucosamine 6-phosphate synthetase-like amidotransferase/phosphosugar isomerase protein
VEKISQVEKALRNQGQIWREVVQEILKDQVSQSFPLKGPKRIFLMGVGSSFFAAQLTAETLFWARKKQLLSRQVPVLAISSVATGMGYFPQPGDWVFGFSHRGKTEATLNALKACSEAGALTILVASREAEWNPDLSQIFLPTGPLEKCEPHTQGLTSAVCAVTTLFLGQEGGDAWKKLSLQPLPDLSELQKKIQEVPPLILGEWIGEWLAREISLKLTEMVQARVPVYGSEEFFHGPRVLSLAQDRPESLWYIEVEGDPRASQIPTSKRVRIRSDSLLSWVDGLVELQWWTLALALNLGKNPDGE